MRTGYLASLVLIAVSDIVAALWIWETRDFPWMEENALVENVQVALLLAVTLVFIWRSFYTTPVLRILATGAAAVSAMLLLRELDLRQTWVPVSAAALFHEGHGKDLLIAGVAASFGIFAVVHWRSVVPAVRAALTPRAGAYVLPATLLWIAELFERFAEMYGTRVWVALEESVELNAYMLLLLAGIFLPILDASGGALRPASDRAIDA